MHVVPIRPIPSCVPMCVPVLLTFFQEPPVDYNRVIVIAHALAQLIADHLVLVGVGAFIEVQASAAFCVLLSVRFIAR